MYDVIIVGGGAAGMMAAISASKQMVESGNSKPKVLLLEKNEKLGKKIYITGKGRCNVTNASDIEDILKCITKNYQFMYSSIYGFTNDDMVELLEQNGCPTKVERGKRVFPVSDHASDVTQALQRVLKQYKVEIKLHSEVKDLLLESDTNNCVCKGVVLSDGSKYFAEKVIVATGGCSYPSTGSTGDGYTFAKKAGHKIIPVRPGLVPFVTREPYISEMQGLALKNIKLVMKLGKKKIYEEQGELLFTHFGVSGPLVLSASAYLPENIDFSADELQTWLDLKPALSEKQLDERILRDFEQGKNKDVKNVLEGLLPRKMVPVMVSLMNVDENKKVHDITKEERLLLVQLLKQFPFTVNGLRGFQEAIITKGGIDVKEIDPGNMESKLVKHLHFAGEVLDLDALTGGYNLQIAWSTGYASGNLW